MSRAVRRSQILPAPPSLNPKSKITIARSGIGTVMRRHGAPNVSRYDINRAPRAAARGTMEPDDKNRHGRHIERSAAEGTESAPICTTTSPS